MRPLSEQTILVTGATDGLGRALVGELASRGARVLAHGRDPAKLRALRDETGVEVVRADLAELRQVDRLAEELLQRDERLDVLVNNAGVGTGRDPSRREESRDGYELRFAVNYLAAYHLTRRLLPLLRAPARIVNIASAGQQEFSFTDPQLRRHYSGAAAYMRSKLALVMFTLDLASQLDGSGITVNALHPATFMDTTMVRESGRIPVTAVADGVAATLRLVAGQDVEGETGRFFDGDHEAPPHPQARSPKARERLRRLSDELVTDALA
ncbi:SDR family NAD(P)-dependent oxidoreductase [Saccharomonospora piscinae]|uniref:SDR family NAD(P)-dependent oxidoreductase n=1 Tax=Saccharomonospora piscinae TaxID=687388 RepID=UPI001105D02A|nr:SDR family NAD(P)-dependent oxidoreductase [Saccharomonospora piscinae]TLW89704.1 SDR family NAD(P)-dependent oxidoreductase [Saccharomonospora piscinae]